MFSFKNVIVATLPRPDRFLSVRVQYNPSLQKMLKKFKKGWTRNLYTNSLRKRPFERLKIWEVNERGFEIILSERFRY